MEKVSWKVEGMSCTNCALTIHKYLEKKGLGNVKVNFIGGDVSFDINGGTSKPEIEKGIESLGYHVVHSGGAGQTSRRNFFLKNHLQIKLDFLNPTGVVLITTTFCAVFPSMQNLYAANFLYPAFDITVIQKQDLSFPFLSGNNLTLVRLTAVLISVS